MNFGILLNPKKARTGDDAWMKSEDYWSVGNVLVADLVNGALFKELRSLGTAGKELIDVADVFAPDGLMKSIEDKLIVGLVNTKRTRYFTGKKLAELRTNRY
ncbi:MAG: hypothetical protein CM15mV75_380 [uncultured marine virus]|nr:MAG: hypothetical protein CM15mV75_380 [uncultured marine virus]